MRSQARPPHLFQCVRIVDYVGEVCLGANEDRSSDYVCDFGERSQFALDANTTGNEARFINDYRNTGAWALQQPITARPPRTTSLPDVHDEL